MCALLFFLICLTSLICYSFLEHQCSPSKVFSAMSLLYIAIALINFVFFIFLQSYTLKLLAFILFAPPQLLAHHFYTNLLVFVCSFFLFCFLLLACFPQWIPFYSVFTSTMILSFLCLVLFCFPF